MAVITDRIDPPIEDGRGYHLRYRDLVFLDIGVDNVRDWRERRAPLGLSRRQYDALRAELTDALQRDSVPLDDCDTRLKGSSAEFFAAPHKPLPLDKDAIVELFRQCRGRVPSGWEVDEIYQRLTGVWLTDGDVPKRRPFDSMFRIGISREPSDIDLQLASDAVVRRCESLLTDLGLPVTDARMSNPVYNFVRKDLVESVLPNLYLFSLRLTDAVGRHVSIAVFPAAGPPDQSAEVGDLSAHFRPSDWCVSLGP